MKTFVRKNFMKHQLQDHPEICLSINRLDIHWPIMSLFSSNSIFQEWLSPLLQVGPYTRNPILLEFFFYSSNCSGTSLTTIAGIWELNAMLTLNARSETSYGGKDSVSCWCVSSNTSLLVRQCLAKVHNIKNNSQEYILKIPEGAQVNMGKKEG